jgi:3-oxoacyl-[acyl-carrier protein] reductase
VARTGQDRRVALVTGSTRGLGRAIARRLGRDGLAVALNGLHDDAAAREAVGEVRAGGGEAELSRPT